MRFQGVVRVQPVVWMRAVPVHRFSQAFIEIDLLRPAERDNLLAVDLVALVVQNSAFNILDVVSCFEIGIIVLVFDYMYQLSSYFENGGSPGRADVVKLTWRA